MLAVIPAAAHADPVTIREPVAPPIDGDGNGLCMASAVSTNPTGDFSLANPANFNGAVNAFMEARRSDRIEYVVRTLLDLSNNNVLGTQASLGDFRNAMPNSCGAGGCGFFVNDDRTRFGSRLRGYFNVTNELAGKPIHFGFYVDDAVSLTIYDKRSVGHPVVTRAPEIGAPTWRLTETVIFENPGLYPIEIIYVEIVDHAALEISYYVGNFVDFERTASESPVIELDAASFTLFPPTAFFQTLSGIRSFADDNTCLQCNRQYVNQPGNNGCPSNGYYCNEAALCAPCDTALFCGPSCSPCGGETPFCHNINGTNQCVGCRLDADCELGYRCDPQTNTCQECNIDADCGRGEYCVNKTCVPCSTSDSCAGNSCNCCPTGANGQPMQCVDIEVSDIPVCVECRNNTDCSSGVCDVLIGRCVDELAQNERSDCCGDDCLRCPAEFPFCLPGQDGTACAQCRWDTDCPDGEFCSSGSCQPCTRDRHCGSRCESCGGETPYCLGGQTAELSTCVQCIDDSQCPGGTCDLTTHTCRPTCMVSCGDSDGYCYGDTCVECYADTQCPCGGTCDLASNTCSSSCKRNTDCLGTEHCAWSDEMTEKECVLGPMPSDTACGTTLANACTISAGSSHASPPWGVLGLLSIIVLALRRQRRGAVLTLLRQRRRGHS